MEESSNPNKHKSLLGHGDDDDDVALTTSLSKKRRRNWKPAPLNKATNRKQGEANNDENKPCDTRTMCKYSPS